MLDSTLMVVHFLGLALGLSTGFANMVMAGLIAKAAPQEQAVLGRFPPAMAKVGAIGLALLWASGIVLLTIIVGYIHILMPRAQRGDAAAAARIRLLGMLTGPLAIIAIIFAVITFG
jgi:hypothetical protein